ncbi:NAD binding Rossmann fold oxidoreductase [Schizopora paradoxa]|uniref:D-xylose 1-dehydrogenase (NADP(+), D-xylono-1,5-lactone-forming) n=1 Tax=Schizopora paradoxa TaxID=27342 RepID=A0A0H2RGU0_9AGAM|nr:NAD binding Rossmann fold oxidoreductase [Schizopora paradoxa]
MAMILQLSTFLHQFWYARQHAVAVKSPIALRMGVLSTAMINYAAIFKPAQTHPDVIIHAIASRDAKTAADEAKKYGIPKSYGSYQALLDDQEIEAVYISLPNGMHCEWAVKALQRGKHVLLEKPFTSNLEEAIELVKVAKEKGLILLEAFHWQFHPAAHFVDHLVASGRYGKILRTYSRMTTPAGTIPASDIRYKYDLAGGSLMDMGYVISSTRFFLGVGAPEEVTSARARVWPHDVSGKVDEAMEATLTFRSPMAPKSSGKVVSEIYSDMRRENVGWVIPRFWEMPSIEIECEKATIYFFNFMMPHFYHYVAVTDKKTGKTETFKHYRASDSGIPTKWGSRGEAWWSTYRYQLEAFVDKVRGREPVHWVSNEDSVDQMRTIDMVYEKSGLGKRRGTGQVM